MSAGAPSWATLVRMCRIRRACSRPVSSPITVTGRAAAGCPPSARLSWRWQDEYVDVDDPPALRAIPEEGRPWDSPSEGRLYLLLQDIEAGAGDFLIVERTTDPSGETYAQVLRNDDSSYVVEHREGDAGNHYGTVVPDMRAAWEMLTGWAFQRPGWDQEASWSRVDCDPPPDTGAGLAPPAPARGRIRAGLKMRIARRRARSKGRRSGFR
jgi:hypothetical protein